MPEPVEEPTPVPAPVPVAAPTPAPAPVVAKEDTAAPTEAKKPQAAQAAPAAEWRAPVEESKEMKAHEEEKKNKQKQSKRFLESESVVLPSGFCPAPTGKFSFCAPTETEQAPVAVPPPATIHTAPAPTAPVAVQPSAHQQHHQQQQQQPQHQTAGASQHVGAQSMLSNQQQMQQALSSQEKHYFNRNEWSQPSQSEAMSGHGMAHPSSPSSPARPPSPTGDLVNQGGSSMWTNPAQKQHQPASHLQSGKPSSAMQAQAGQQQQHQQQQQLQQQQQRAALNTGRDYSATDRYARNITGGQRGGYQGMRSANPQMGGSRGNTYGQQYGMNNNTSSQQGAGAYSQSAMV